MRIRFPDYDDDDFEIEDIPEYEKRRKKAEIRAILITCSNPRTFFRSKLFKILAHKYAPINPIRGEINQPITTLLMLPQAMPDMPHLITPNPTEAPIEL